MKLLSCSFGNNHSKCSSRWLQSFFFSSLESFFRSKEKKIRKFSSWKYTIKAAKRALTVCFTFQSTFSRNSLLGNFIKCNSKFNLERVLFSLYFSSPNVFLDGCFHNSTFLFVCFVSMQHEIINQFSTSVYQ